MFWFCGSLCVQFYLKPAQFVYLAEWCASVVVINLNIVGYQKWKSAPNKTLNQKRAHAFTFVVRHILEERLWMFCFAFFFCFSCSSFCYFCFVLFAAVPFLPLRLFIYKFIYFFARFFFAALKIITCSVHYVENIESENWVNCSLFSLLNLQFFSPSLRHSVSLSAYRICGVYFLA